MRVIKLLYLLAGLGLLGAIMLQVDLAAVAASVIQVGWGMGLIVAIYAAAFAIDTFTWQMTLPSMDLGRRWHYRLFQVRLAGEAFNATTPMAGMGGEPVKAVLLKKYYAIDYPESLASLVLAKTVNMISLIIFLAGGFAFMLAAPEIPVAYKSLAATGFIAFATGVLLFFLIQRFKVTSLTGKWLQNTFIGGLINRFLHHLEEMDQRLVTYYTVYSRRFGWGVALAWVNWMLGVLEIHYTMIFLGHRIAFTDSWIIEVVAQLVRTATFFIPASIGAQEGAFLIIGTAMTGSPTLGIAVAVVRRFREILWIGLGFGALLVLKPATENRAADE